MSLDDGTTVFHSPSSSLIAKIIILRIFPESFFIRPAFGHVTYKPFSFIFFLLFSFRHCLLPGTKRLQASLIFGS